MKKLVMVICLIVFYSSFWSCKNNAEFKLFPVLNGDEYQYIDENGVIVINPQFAEASLFRDGIALVKTSGDTEEYGYINEKGKYIIMPRFKEATTFSEGIAWVVEENGYPTAINKQGEILFTLKEAESVRIYENGLAAFSVIEKGDEKWGFVDKKGEIKITPQFDDVGTFKDELCPAENDKGKWGYINKKGVITINYQFDYAKEFNNGQAIVSYNDKYGAINKEGKYVINPQFKAMIDDNSLYVININGKWGWCDRDGEIVINPQFSDVNFFRNSDLAPVEMNDKYGYIDKKGKIVINPQFELAFPFCNNHAFVSLGDKYGAIDTKGKFNINPQFDQLTFDYYAYLYGTSYFNSVTTDYVNLLPVVHRIMISQPENLSFTNNLSDVMKTFKLKENDINSYEKELQLIHNEEVVSGITLDFVVIFNDYLKKYNYYSWDYTINNNASINAFMYHIELFGKARNKEESLEKAIVATLTNYTKDEEHSNEYIKFYKNKNQYISIMVDDSELVIAIFKSLDIFNKNKYNDNYGDSYLEEMFDSVEDTDG